MTYAHIMQTNVRRARKSYPCEGDGARPAQHAAGCPLTINPGDEYVENLEGTAAYQSGTRHSIACGKEFHGVDEVDE